MARNSNRYQIKVNGCIKAVGSSSRIADVLAAWTGLSVAHAQDVCKVSTNTVRVLRYQASAYAKQNPDLTVHVDIVDEYEMEQNRQALAQQAIDADVRKEKKDGGATYLKIIEDEGVPEPVFDFLAQAGVVSQLLDKITEILPSIPDSDAKTALLDHLRTFENTVVLTTWNTADVSAHLKNGITEEDAKAVLEVMVSRYGVEESDWDAITTAYEICQALDADSQII